LLDHRIFVVKNVPGVKENQDKLHEYTKTLPK
jgi:hypothetical protein